MAENGDKVSLEAFVKGLKDVEMGSAEDATRIFSAFENHFTGHIDMKEFLFDIRNLSKVNMMSKRQLN